MKNKETEKQYCEELTEYKLKNIQKVYVFLKALMDFFIAFFGLLLCFIPFIVVAIAIKCDSKGPVFFTQARVGKKGKIFKCIKFRTMRTDANHSIAGYEYAEVNQYITRVGRFLRKTSIDELPQLFNLLNGTMSLIGYRPSQDNEEELLEARKALNVYQVRPGITGWAQVNGRDVLAAQPTLKAKYDGYYLKNISFLFDLKILFKTIFNVLKHEDIVEGK